MTNLITSQSGTFSADVYILLCHINSENFTEICKDCFSETVAEIFCSIDLKQELSEYSVLYLPSFSMFIL